MFLCVNYWILLQTMSQVKEQWAHQSCKYDVLTFLVTVVPKINNVIYRHCYKSKIHKLTLI